MIIKALSISDVLLIEPKVFNDDRGFFFESFNQLDFEKETNLFPKFVQENHSKSVKGVLRGLHYQLSPNAQDKLIRVVRGEIFDVAVDIRKDSPSFGKYVSAFLTEENKKQLWIPKGFAHGFITISETAELVYKATKYYSPESERSIRWDDPKLNIDWSLNGIKPLISSKDKNAKFLSESELLR